MCTFKNEGYTNMKMFGKAWSLTDINYLWILGSVYSGCKGEALKANITIACSTKSAFHPQ